MSTLQVAIANATPDEQQAITNALNRANDKPAVIVTLRQPRRRYVVVQEDEGLFQDLIGLSDEQLAERVKRAYTVPFGAQWLRGYGRVDEMYRSLCLYEVVKVTTADRRRVWGH